MVSACVYAEARVGWGRQLGPAEVAPKRAYIFRDVVRKATLAGLPECLPVRPPPTHPFRPLLPLRVTGCPILTDAQRSVGGWSRRHTRRGADAYARPGHWL
jgi:hypothetical protein